MWHHRGPEHLSMGENTPNKFRRVYRGEVHPNENTQLPGVRISIDLSWENSASRHTTCALILTEMYF